MIIIDSARQKLHAEGNPINAAMLGAGYIDHGIDFQILEFLNGIELVAISILMLAGSGQYLLHHPPFFSAYTAKLALLGQGQAPLRVVGYTD